MSPTAPRFDCYQIDGGSENILLHGLKYGIQVIIIEPLFEERNFLRRNLVGMARALALRGIGSALPDLPGTGDSLADGDQMTLDDWHNAAAAATAHIAEQTGALPHIASFRGGALIDHTATAASWWRFAPTTGSDLLRTMRRAQRFGDAQEGDYTGYHLAPEMVEQLEGAFPHPLPASYHEASVPITGTPPWRRAEPGDDPGLIAALAEDLAGWIETCASR